MNAAIAKLRGAGMTVDKIDEYKAAWGAFWGGGAFTGVEGCRARETLPPTLPPHPSADLFDFDKSGKLTVEKLGVLLNDKFSQTYAVEVGIP